MATYYVDSNAIGANDGSSKTDAYTSLITALSGKAAGDIFLVSHLHNESSTGAKTLTTPGADDGIVYIISLNFITDVPTPGAKLESLTSTITFNAAAYFYGLTFATNAISGHIYFHGINGTHLDMNQCTFSVAGGYLYLGSTSTFDYHGDITLRDCKFNITHANSRFLVRNSVNVRVVNPDFSGSTVNPYEFVTGSNSLNGHITFEGADLSVFTSATELIRADKVLWDVDFIRCKLMSGYVVNTATWPHNNRVRLSQCATNDSNCIEEVHSNTGSMVTNTGIYINDASKPDVTGLVQGGVQISGLSWQVVTTSLVKPGYPFHVDLPLAIWKAAGTYTLYVELLYEGAQLTENDVWLELNGFTETASAQGKSTAPPAHESFVPGLSTPANLSSIATSSDWVHSLTSPTANKVSKSITTTMDGYITGRLRLTVPNRTIFVNPQLRTV